MQYKVLVLRNYTINQLKIIIKLKKKIIMKTTNQNNRSIHLSAIFFSAIASALFVTSSFANVSLNDQQALETENNLEIVLNASFSASSAISKPEMSADSEIEIANSVATISADYVKPILETISENEQIIESSEDFNLPIYSGRTIDEIILENEMIIESNQIDDFFPLNRNLINTNSVENREGVILKNNSELKS